MDIAALAPLEKEKTYPEPVRTEWKMLARIRILSPSITKLEIAGRMGYSYGTINRWLDDMAYQRFENFLLDKTMLQTFPEVGKDDVSHRVRTNFVSYSEEMQKRMYDIIESTTDNKLQADLCRDWLDRSGFAPVKQEQRLALTVTLTADALKELERRKTEAGL